MKFSDQIRNAIKRSGPAFPIARACGIDPATLSRFLAGGGIAVTSLDTLAEFLNLRIQDGAFDAHKLEAASHRPNLENMRLRCIDDEVVGIVSNFPRVGFKRWEARERELLSAQFEHQVRLTHYRLDSPEGRRRLTAEQLSEFNLS